ncbi:AMP-binding protein [Enterobacter ludwigii]|uniref:AMP-dependent synthetase n=1 Tax=Enterobacter cloacae TaxID=550 RepID=A0A4Q2EBA5_ENTCL|nr:AMP-binding protein [Enterobacter cloacae]RXW30760.1 AMP-dependent synthetase [Enterobacter cloacae]
MKAFWALEQHGDRIAAVNEQGESLSYRELNQAVTRLAAELPARALVFCLCENTFGALVGYLACLNAHAVPLMLDKSIAPERLGQLLERYRPGFIWQHSNGSSSVDSYFGYSLHELHQPAPPMDRSLALLIATSGSTGSPKLVRQSYQNLLSNTCSIINYLGIDGNERPLAWLPMNYVYGLSIINTHLAQGATLLLTNSSPVQPEFWQFLKQQGATSLSGVPYSWEMLKKLRFIRMDLPSLKTLTQAGGKLRPELHRELAEWAGQKGIRFFVMYGASEATSRMGYLPAELAASNPGVMGMAIPGGRFALEDDDGNEVIASGQRAELIYYGENVTLGYATCREDLNNGDERRGRLATGDLALRDEKGLYTIVGRKSRFLKVFGNRVGLDELEHLVNSSFPQMECVVTGRDDRVQVFITDAAAAEPVKHYLSTSCNLHHSAFNVVSIDTIPKNPAGKTLYRELEALCD